MSESGIIEAIKSHKEELACIGVASICYNLIQYLRNKKNQKDEKHETKT